VKSGHAIAVLLTGTTKEPSAFARTDVALSDPKIRETRQPYHHGFFRHEEDANAIARRIRVVERCARKSVDALIGAIAGGSPKPRIQAALVVGSVIDPATVGNPHIRAHASEGRLFRVALAEALAAHGVACEVIVEKQLRSRATDATGRSAAQIARAVDAFGDVVGGPWRADDKAAATAAWIALPRARGAAGRPRARKS
jgi:hypothetical protein